MEIAIDPGVEGKEEMVVSANDTADKFGSGLVPVFATPAMIALMEKTCLHSVLGFLPEGFGTVGTKVDIVHIKATPVGMKVICESKLIEVDKRRLTFKVTARDEKGEIGSGHHQRYIINTKQFMEKL